MDEAEAEDLLLVSYHEAGHALLRYQSGSQIEYISVERHANRTCGFMGGTHAAKGSKVGESHLYLLGGYATALILLEKDSLHRFASEDALFNFLSQDNSLTCDVENYFRFSMLSQGKYPPYDVSTTEKECLFRCAAKGEVLRMLKESWPAVEGIAEVVQNSVRRYLGATCDYCLIIPAADFASHLRHHNEC